MLKVSLASVANQLQIVFAKTYPILVWCGLVASAASSVLHSDFIKTFTSTGEPSTYNLSGGTDESGESSDRVESRDHLDLKRTVIFFSNYR